MQNFAVNGGALNGDPQVWLDEEALAQIVFQADGEVMRGAMVEATAQIVVSGAGELFYQAKLQGTASTVISAAGEIQRGAVVEGTASVPLAVAGDFTRWAMIEGISPFEFFADGDVQVVPGVSATFSVILSATGDVKVSTGQHLEGLAPVLLSASMDAHIAKPVHIGGYTDIELASIGYGSLVIQSPPGAALIEFAGSGEFRFGERAQLEGYAGIELFSRGDVSTIHYVYAEGTATIEVAAWAAVAGKPIIPTDYEPASSARTIIIAREARERSLAREHRSVA